MDYDPFLALFATAVTLNTNGYFYNAIQVPHYTISVIYRIEPYDGLSSQLETSKLSLSMQEQASRTQAAITLHTATPRTQHSFFHPPPYP